jgi:hypothetical protein
MSEDREPEYRFSFTVTADDVVDYLRVVQRTLNLIGVGLGVGMVVLGIWIMVIYGSVVDGAVPVLLGLATGVAAQTRYFDAWRVRRNARSILGTGALLEFDGSGLSSKTATGAGTVPWSTITRVRSSDRILVFARDRLTVAWLPTRVFTSAEQRDSFSSFVAAHLGQG